MAIDKSIADTEAQLARAREQCRHSVLTWQFDLMPRLERLTADFHDRDGPERAYHRTFDRHPFPRFEITAMSGRLLPSKDREGQQEFEIEDEAAFVVSMAANGAVSVIIYPHESAWGKIGDGGGYIVDFVTTARHLSGLAGDRKLFEYVELFLEVVNVSSSYSLPSRRSAKLIAKLDTKHQKYRRLFQSNEDFERNALNADISMGIGLVGGLLASSLIPMLQTYGQENKNDADKIEASCKSDFKDNPQAVALCLATNRDYKRDRDMQKYFSTEVMIGFAITLFVLFTWILKRQLRRR